jgi:uncharacterized protein YhbP (UPF0306 family)
MAPSELYKSLSEYLELSTLSLATVDPEGRPHAAPVYFVADDDLRLYYFSDEASRHAGDTAASGLAAAAIYPECFGWQEIRGLQLEGAVQAVPAGAHWEKVWELYQAKFPFVGELRQVVERNILYAFTPHWLRLVDNRRVFGFKEEWVIP